MTAIRSHEKVTDKLNDRRATFRRKLRDKHSQSAQVTGYLLVSLAFLRAAIKSLRQET